VCTWRPSPPVIVVRPRVYGFPYGGGTGRGGIINAFNYIVVPSGVRARSAGTRVPKVVRVERFDKRAKLRADDDDDVGETQNPAECVLLLIGRSPCAGRNRFRLTSIDRAVVADRQNERDDCVIKK